MEQWEFYREVFAHIPRATRSERRAIRRELQGHMEDSAEVYERAGHPAEKAASKAVEAMGDPAEIGKAFNEQLSPFWLWLGRGCLAVTAVFCVLLLSNSKNLFDAGENLMARVAPSLLVQQKMEEYVPRDCTLFQNIDLRLELEDEVIRVCRFYMDPDSGRVGVGAVCYSRDIHGWTTYFVRFPDGSGADTMARYSPYGMRIVVEEHFSEKPDEPYVTLVCERREQRWELEIPLPWEVTS